MCEAFDPIMLSALRTGAIATFNGSARIWSFTQPDKLEMARKIKRITFIVFATLLH